MNYKHLKINDIEDQAPSSGVDSLEARPLRSELGAEPIGLTDYRVKPGRRVGFGHSHDEVEEVYLVLSGSGRFKLDDDIIDVGRGRGRLLPAASGPRVGGRRGRPRDRRLRRPRGGRRQHVPGWWTD